MAISEPSVDLKTSNAVQIFVYKAGCDTISLVQDISWIETLGRLGSMPKEGNCAIRNAPKEEDYLDEMWKISLWQILPFGRKAGGKKNQFLCLERGRDSFQILN